MSSHRKLCFLNGLKLELRHMFYLQFKNAGRRFGAAKFDSKGIVSTVCFALFLEEYVYLKETRKGKEETSSLYYFFEDVAYLLV